MAIRVHVNVVSAEELIFSGETDFAVFPGEAGELGIYPRHTPLLTRIKPGTVRLKIPDRDDYEMVYVSGGMLEVQPALITVLADTAIRAHDLDKAKAMEAKGKAGWKPSNNRKRNVSPALKAYAAPETGVAYGRSNPVMRSLINGQYSLAELRQIADYLGHLPGDVQTVSESRFRK